MTDTAARSCAAGAIVPPLRTAEPDAPLNGLTPAMRVALLILHTSSVAGAPPVVLWPQRNVFQRCDLASKAPIGPEIQAGTIKALVARELVECVASRLCPKMSCAKLTSNGRWYARTIDRQVTRRLAETTGISSQAKGS
jgi:hypothetical protein